MEFLLIIDVSYLSHRAFHTTGFLEHLGNPTGVLFGVLRDIQTLTARWKPDKFVFAFDGPPPNKRLALYPEYKGNRVAKRKEMTDEEREARAGMHKQIDQLRSELLTKIGYSNIFCERGYEADDIIAKVCHDNHDKVKCIVSSDEDLFQLIDVNTFCYNVRRQGVVGSVEFAEKYNGITPDQWPLVKAIAGCSGDNVQGIQGVGEVKACQYLLGTMNQKTKTYSKIESNTELIKRNLPLVRLPFPGLPEFIIRDDNPSRRNFNDVLDMLGINLDGTRRQTERGAFF